MTRIVCSVLVISIFVSAAIAGGNSDCTEITANFENLSQGLQTQFYDLITLSSHRPEQEIILAVKEETLDILNTYPDLGENDVDSLYFIDSKGDSGAICIIKFINTTDA
ncbi:unnamed protein product [Chironomus riparius]|uniref:Uncharacterized protein n=1 Tax=Chironomus riparius TaxID=315576 RepID=A0A9N9RMF3_9DIPT|nr:unnamed protein product [Chironomus riparius]